MADINSSSSTRDAEIEELKIYSPHLPEGVDIRLMYQSFSIFEDISMPVTTGRIIIEDGINLYSRININGSQFLKITFKKPGSDDLKYSKTFRIYAVTDRTPSNRSLTQVYTIHFCSEELIFSNQQKVSKAYKNKSASDHVKAILTDYLKTPRAKINSNNFEKSYGRTDFVFTSFKPIEAIRKLAEYAYSTNGSTFLFF